MISTKSYYNDLGKKPNKQVTVAFLIQFWLCIVLAHFPVTYLHQGRMPHNRNHQASDIYPSITTTAVSTKTGIIPNEYVQTQPDTDKGIQVKPCTCKSVQSQSHNCEYI